MLACLADTNRTVQVPHVSPIRLLGTESRIDASNLRGIHVVHAIRNPALNLYGLTIHDDIAGSSSRFNPKNRPIAASQPVHAFVFIRIHPPEKNLLSSVSHDDLASILEELANSDSARRIVAICQSRHLGIEMVRHTPRICKGQSHPSPMGSSIQSPDNLLL